MPTYFYTSYTTKFTRKFVMGSLSKIPPEHKCIATLPFEIFVTLLTDSGRQPVFALHVHSVPKLVNLSELKTAHVYQLQNTMEMKPRVQNQQLFISYLSAYILVNSYNKVF